MDNFRLEVSPGAIKHLQESFADRAERLSSLPSGHLREHIVTHTGISTHPAPLAKLALGFEKALQGNNKLKPKTDMTLFWPLSA